MLAKFLSSQHIKIVLIYLYRYSERYKFHYVHWFIAHLPASAEMALFTQLSSGQHIVSVSSVCTTPHTTSNSSPCCTALMLYNYTRKMPHAYLELQYKYEGHAYLKHIGEPSCVTGKESEWIYAWPISLPSPQVLREGAVSLPLLNDIFLWTEVHCPSPTLPFCLFLETKTQVSSKPRAEGACVSLADTSTSRFSADSCRAILGLPEQCSRKSSNVWGNPLLSLLLFWQKD